jgi:hypothetical protein
MGSDSVFFLNGPHCRTASKKKPSLLERRLRFLQLVPLGGVGPPFDAYKATVLPLNYSGV